MILPKTLHESIIRGLESAESDADLSRHERAAVIHLYIGQHLSRKFMDAIRTNLADIEGLQKLFNDIMEK